MNPEPHPQVLYKDGQPSHIVLDITEYEAIVAILEEYELAAALEQAKANPNGLVFQKAEEVWKEMGL